MARSRPSGSVVLVVTEASPVERLWRAVLDMARDQDLEVAVLIVGDDRWYRAASLPFTREISRTGAASTNFTRERAESLSEASITQLRGLVEALASPTHIRCSYHVVRDERLAELEGLVTARPSILVASTVMAGLPIYKKIRGLAGEIVLVDALPEAGRKGA